MRAAGTLGERVFEFSPEFGVFEKAWEIPKFGFKVLEAKVLRIDGLPSVGHRMAKHAVWAIDFERNNGLERFNRMDALAIR